MYLTRHFFNGFFRLSFLDDAGEESFKRAILALLAVAITFGLALTRLYAGKYASLIGRVSPEAFGWIAAADQLFILCLPMFVLTLLMAFVSHSIFPDETDFWTLMPLPLTRGEIFRSKLLAVLLFSALFVAGTNVGVTLPLALVTGGGASTHGVGLLTQLLASAWASLFVVLAVVALQGAILVVAPRARHQAWQVALQTAIVCGLVLLLPLLFRVPGLWRLLQQRPEWWIYVPPAWFLGVQQWISGNRDPFFARLAAAAIVGTSAAFAVAAAGCLTAYSRFDCAVLKGPQQGAPLGWNVRLTWPWTRHPAREAVYRFTSATLHRSGLHQLVVLGTFAAGAALAINNLLGVIDLSERWLVRAALGTPFTMMAGAVVGLRAALLLPTNLRAGWIFRFTETAASRRQQIAAVGHSLFALGVVLPVAFALPLQVALLGAPTAAALLPLTLLIGWLFVEVVSHDWRRIPFTCTFLFAKRPPAYTVFLALTIFGWFVFIAASVLLAARSSVSRWWIVATILASMAAALEWHKRQSLGDAPLEFEDYLPDGLDTLRLH